MFFKKMLLLVTLLAYFASPSSSKVLPIATAEFPPFKYIDSATGKVIGSDTEIIRRVFQTMNIEVEIRNMPFKRADHDTRKGKYAAYYTFTKNQERETAYYFSDPISAVQDVLFKRKTSKIAWEKYEDLADYKLGYSSKYNYDKKFMASVKNKQATASSKAEEQLLKKLAKGRVDMVICEVTVCSWILDQSPELKAKIDYIDRPVRNPPLNPFHIGFSKKWPNAKTLRDDFNTALKKFAAQPDKPRKKIMAKYSVVCPTSLFPDCK